MARAARRGCIQPIVFAAIDGPALVEEGARGKPLARVGGGEVGEGAGCVVKCSVCVGGIVGGERGCDDLRSDGVVEDAGNEQVLLRRVERVVVATAVVAIVCVQAVASPAAEAPT